MSTKILFREAEELSAEQKIDLAYKLFESIEENPEYERLWIEEIERRCKEFDEGKTQAIPAEEVIERLRADLASMEYPPEEPLVPRPFEETVYEALRLEDWERVDIAYHLLRLLQDEGFQIDWEREEVVGRSREPLPAIDEKP